MKIPQPKYIMNVSMPIDLAQRLETLAATRRTTRSALIREAIEKLLLKDKVK